MQNNSTNGNGGAVKVKIRKRSNQIAFSSLRDVFYKNSAKKDGESSKGGAIAISDNHALELSNTLLGYNLGEKNYDNIFVESNEIDIIKNSFGVDNGKDIGNTSEKIYGKYPIKLMKYEDEDWIIGYIGHRDKLANQVRFPLIPIISDKDGNVITGIASAEHSNIDSDKELSGNNIGGFSMNTLLYDANGGNFNLPQLILFDGTVYYEGTKPKYYVEQKNHIVSWEDDRLYYIKDGVKDLGIVRDRYRFLGWSMKHDDDKPNQEFVPKSSIQPYKQKKLFAIWQPNTYQLTYYGTSKSSGTTPAVTKAKYNTTATIKSAGTMKRKGHKFLGWSTKSNQSKAKYVAGTKVKMTSNVKLYPVWKANKYALNYNNTSKTSGTAPKNVSATYGKSYTIKNAGSMKRKGYKFLGWSKKAKQSKADAKLKTGKKLKVLGTTNLYPVWKKAK